jgi:hypothetical protein
MRSVLRATQPELLRVQDLASRRSRPAPPSPLSFLELQKAAAPNDRLIQDVAAAVNSVSQAGGATFYTTGMEHSPTSATGTGWERTPWHATQRAAWEALKKAEGGR